MLGIYILEIDRNLKTEEFARLLNFVSKEKQERIQRFRRYEDAQRAVLGDLMARSAILGRASIKNKDLFFGTNDYGKPFLHNPSGLHFNISHSGKWVACAVDNNPVGIDVEEVKPIDFKIAERFFSASEYESIISQPEEKRVNCFYRIWTLKESFVKAEGKGLSIPLHSFSMEIDQDSIKAKIGDEYSRYTFSQIWQDKSAVTSVCSLDINPYSMENYNVDSFLSFLSNHDYF